MSDPGSDAVFFKIGSKVLMKRKGPKELIAKSVCRPSLVYSIFWFASMPTLFTGIWVVYQRLFSTDIMTPNSVLLTENIKPLLFAGKFVRGSLDIFQRTEIDEQHVGAPTVFKSAVLAKVFDRLLYASFVSGCDVNLCSICHKVSSALRIFHPNSVEFSRCGLRREK